MFGSVAAAFKSRSGKHSRGVSRHCCRAFSTLSVSEPSNQNARTEKLFGIVGGGLHSGGGGVVAHGQQVLDEDVGVQQHQVRVQLPRHLDTATAQHSLSVRTKRFWMSRLSSK